MLLEQRGSELRAGAGQSWTVEGFLSALSPSLRLLLRRHRLFLLCSPALHTPQARGAAADRTLQRTTQTSTDYKWHSWQLCVTFNSSDTCKQDVWGKRVKCDQSGGEHGACVSIREAHKGSSPLNGGKGGKVTSGMKELSGSECPQHHRSPGHIKSSWKKGDKKVWLTKS